MSEIIGSGIERTASWAHGPSRFVNMTERVKIHHQLEHCSRQRARLRREFRPICRRKRLDDLLDAIQERGRMDLIRDYALPLPTTIIAEMLGVPVRDRHKFHRWSNAIVSTVPSTWGLLKAIPSLIAFLHYIRRLVRTRRAAPQDDLVSALVEAREAGDQLSEDELLAMVSLLLIAGHETTVNLIGNGMLALMEHPQQLDRLRDDPGLIKPAVEELLRYDGPLQTATERYAPRTTTGNQGRELPSSHGRKCKCRSSRTYRMRNEPISEC